MSKNNLYIVYFVLISILGHIQAQSNVACIGNSITWGSKLPDPANQSYPVRLSVHLGNDYSVINYGEPGATLLLNTWKPYIETYTHETSIAKPHDIVIILLGTNDSDETNWVEKDHFKEDYFDLMDDYNMNYPTYGDPVFILGLPLPVFDESEGHRNAPIINEIIPMIKQVADETNSTIADFYNALDGKPELFIDGVHPNSIGTEIMAEIAYDAIQEALHIAYPPPDIPTGLKTIPGLTNINLEWHANIEDDLFSYDIYRSLEKGGFQNNIGVVYSPDTTFSDNNIILDHIYYYSIDAKNSHNVASSRTAPVAGKTIDNIPPNAPVNLQAALEADSVKLSWNPNTELDIEKYYIYRNTTLNDIQQDSSIGGTVYAPNSNFSYVSFSSAINYFFGVTAVDISDNQGLISNVVNITTKSRPISSDTTLTLYENISHHFIVSDFPFIDADNDFLDKIIFINTDQNHYFTYDSDTIASPLTCDDISKLVFTPNLDEFGESYAEFSFRVVDSFGSTSIDTNIVTININDKPPDFNIIAPNNDSTLVINKSNYLNIFSINWEASPDSINDGILYDIIFTGDLSALSRHNINTTNTEYALKEILAATDTVSIANSTFSIIATDGDLETAAINGNIALTIDGRSFAPVKLHLDQNYPNPFNHSTLIGFDLPTRANISIIIYDLLGEEVIKLINHKEHERGYNTITWNGLDKNNNIISAGIYLMQIRMGSNEQHKKLILLK